jgi:hypothetical protein
LVWVLAPEQERLGLLPAGIIRVHAALKGCRLGLSLESVLARELGLEMESPVPGRVLALPAMVLVLAAAG